MTAHRIDPRLMDIGAGSLPFDKESTEAEIIAVLTPGRSIIWMNDFSGAIYTDNIKHVVKVIRRPDDNDYVDLLCDGGFRSLYLSRIVSVG